MVNIWKPGQNVQDKDGKMKNKTHIKIGKPHQSEENSDISGVILGFKRLNGFNNFDTQNRT